MADSLLKFSGCLKKEPAGPRDNRSVVKTEKLSFHFELLEGVASARLALQKWQALSCGVLLNAGICGRRAMVFRSVKSEPSMERLRKALLACLLLS